MFKKKWSVLVASVLVSFVALAASGDAPAPTKDLPGVAYVAAARSVWHMMGDSQYSYIIPDKNEEFSLKVVDAYLEMLDPQRIFFLSEDIEKFRNKPMWALAAMQGRALAAPLRIHEVFALRANQRKQWLDQWQPHKGYTPGQTWEPDRSNTPWASSPSELDEVWQKSMDFSYASRSESTQTPNEIVSLSKERIDRGINMPESEIIELFINAFTSTVDPHASYMTPRNAENMVITLTNSLDGIGALLTEKSKSIVIENLTPGGPAEKSGVVSVGDKILAVAPMPNAQWVDVHSMPVNEVIDMIRGKAGTQVRLRLSKAAQDGAIVEVGIERSRIILSEAGAKDTILEVDGVSVGWIRLPAFYMDMRRDGKGAASATKDVEKSLGRFKERGVSGVVLDLRDNGGGSLEEAVDLVGLFVPPSSAVVQIRNPDENVIVLETDHPKPTWEGPLVVLINGGSASASEIAAGALQDLGRAIIVGEKSFGKGTVQSMFDLDRIWGNPQPSLGHVKITVAQFFLPSGKSTQLNGVKPDVELEANLSLPQGEEQYDNAAPAASINPVKPLSSSAWPIKRLRASAIERTKSSPEFGNWLILREKVRSSISQKEFPLDEASLRKMKEDEDQRIEGIRQTMRELGFDTAAGRTDPVARVAAGVVVDLLRAPPAHTVSRP